MPKRKNSKLCFLCDDIADSRDHIPPLCFFPDYVDRDTQQTVFRHNLITVPACKSCNNNRSKDDHYAQFLIMSEIRRNKVASDYYWAKLWPKLQKEPKFLEQLKQATGLIDINGMEVGSHIVDIKRFVRWLETIFIGLSYNAFKLRPTHIVVVPDGFRHADYTEAKNWNYLSSEIVKSLGKAPWKGSNPSVFAYKSVFDINFNIACLTTKWYEGFISSALLYYPNANIPSWDWLEKVTAEKYR